jgi:hypothetical protein
MNVPSRQPRARGTTSSGTLLALDCARNVYQAVDRHVPDCRTPVHWRDGW